jgi:hypothetical protein
MSETLEAIDGVLCAGLDRLDAANRRATEDSLLLAWRAAEKKMKSGPVPLSALMDVLAQVGWVIKDSRTTNKTAAAGQLATDLSGMLTSRGASPSIAAEIAAGGSAIEAWLNKGGSSHPIIATASATNGTLAISIMQIAITWPAINLLWFSNAAAIQIRLDAATVMLNETVFKEIAEQIAEKVKPYLGEIVH